MKIQECFHALNQLTLDENIQELIRDLRHTQHGDRINPLYDYLKDYHTEGSVWKHTLAALNSISIVAESLGMNDVYHDNINLLRAAILFHDIGKIISKTSSKKRVGSYSFPDHEKGNVVKNVFEKYNVDVSSDLLDLVTQHHCTPTEFAQLDWPKEKLQILVILMACDNHAVGTTSLASAIKHVEPFTAVLP